MDLPPGPNLEEPNEANYCCPAVFVHLIDNIKVHIAMSPLGLWLLVALFGLQSGWQVKAAPFETVALTNTISSATYPTPQMSKRLAVGSSLLASTSSMTTSSSSVVTSHSLPLAQWFLDQVAVASLDNTSLTTTCSSSCSFFSSGIYNISTTTATLNGPQIGDYVCSIVGWAQDCAVCVGGMACLEAYDSLVIQCLQEGLITLSSTVVSRNQDSTRSHTKNLTKIM